MEELKLDHVSQVIGLHPRYLEHFVRTQNFIMQGDGPLPYDYRYYLAIILLDRTLKMFIKTACCFPERITKKHYNNILIELLDSEKVHVNLMIMEARNQAELLYALREIMRYMT